MFIASTGGIFLRLDSSGNLNIYDTSGTTVVKIVGGLVSGKANVGVTNSNTPIANTNSATAVATGYGATITPQVSGRVLVLCAGTCYDSTSGIIVTMSLYLRANSSSNPAGGTAVGSDTQLVTQDHTAAAANARGAFSLSWEGSLTNGQPATVYLAINGGASGTASFGIMSGNPVIIEQ